MAVPLVERQRVGPEQAAQPAEREQCAAEAVEGAVAHLEPQPEELAGMVDSLEGVEEVVELAPLAQVDLEEQGPAEDVRLLRSFENDRGLLYQRAENWTGCCYNIKRLHHCG